MGCAFYFEEDRNLEAGEFHVLIRQVERAIVSEPLELHGLLEAVAGNKAAHFIDRMLDRCPDGVLICIVAEAVDRITHHQRRLCRVENDYGLAALCAADFFDGVRRGLGEFIDIGSCTWPGGF